ncbi:DNA-processing protein DprA [Actinokineospora globicatena]|uniref:DNA-processing protein DprA n=1 Tax=Actinokineospora globicatena TaxID=103729 RepID=UPI0020A2770D|nr:DNA-processing protein DprA [Actinokineospora globicatena]MCP2300491.1 DNA processing protein [Actinokineospora globicatena]GLW81026.1 hypothetical protein Aglo01_55070 [Actinokineospora globicatena]GLW88219.1 hypothetical protein Aglo02_58580 [Actinokineospora globicatena]
MALLRDRPGDVTWRKIADLVADQGGAVEVYRRLQPTDLFDHGADQDQRFERALGEIDAWEGKGYGVHTMLDATYPPQLRDVLHMPPIVFTRGTLVNDARAVAIVGSRQASTEGLFNAARLATGLGERGYTIVSGGAAGIDSAAHTAALACGARTVAVIGTGLDNHYPPENKQLHERIADSGMIMSQFWPESAPSKASFPMRNAVMSGYVAATVVIEAAERSGTRIQARNAVEHGRPVLLADRVVESTNWAKEMLDKPGVYAVSSLADVLRVLERTQDTDSVIRDLLRAGA